MNKWTQIEEISAGDIVLRRNGLKSKPSEIKVLSIRINGDMAYMTWQWKSASGTYFSTDFRKSTNFIDYGSWHNLTSQQWDLESIK